MCNRTNYQFDSASPIGQHYKKHKADFSRNLPYCLINLFSNIIIKQQCNLINISLRDNALHHLKTVFLFYT